MSERTSATQWVVTACMGTAAIFGAVTFRDTYQAMSFVVLILTAISLIVRIRKDIREKDDE